MKHHSQMNSAARIVMYVLGFCVVAFAIAIVLAPFLKVSLPENVPSTFNSLCAFLVGVLAKTGADALPGGKNGPPSDSQ